MLLLSNLLRVLFTGISLLASYAFGQITQVPFDPSPFAIVGYITGATLNNASDILSGGTLTVNDITMIIPRNLLVNTPSLTAVAWSEMFTADGTINLPLWPEVSWEAQVFANFVGGKYIVGLLWIFQEIANLNEGFITHIDYATGELRIGGDFSDPTTGVRAVINDPIGRYGLVHGDWPLWTADTENPSIVASTGFPVCVPRVDPATSDDPLCPMKNRPLDGTGKPLTAFTFEKSPVAPGHPDPNLFAPLVVGDFIIYSGTAVADSNGGRLIAIYEMEASLGFYTLEGTIPVYVRIDVLQAGINGNPAGEIAETRVEGYITDETATIEIFTIDVDPCTGVETERSWGNAVPRLTARKGQWEFRSKDASLSPYTREVVARVSSGTVQTPNGITAGQLVSPYPPCNGMVFPELLVFGNPQLFLEFNLLPFLAQGSGPWLGGIPGIPPTLTGPIVGQLDPWPGVNPPSPASCSTGDPLIPVANAGPDITTLPGSSVTLSGSSNTINIPDDSLSFSWTQLSGPSVNLTGADNAEATFTAPAVNMATMLVFTLIVSDSEGSSNDSVTVVVNPSQVDHITFETVTWKSGKGSGTLTVVASTDSNIAMLTMSATNPNIGPVAMTSLGSNRWQAIVMIKPAPTLVTVTSNLGGAASSTVG